MILTALETLKAPISILQFTMVIISWNNLYMLFIFVLIIFLRNNVSLLQKGVNPAAFFNENHDEQFSSTSGLT
jgi:hypothetical protein